eukprot:gnl/TRDRNA2_/TRDRNA2_58133_c0_seq1.p1 gnl/TRDRNA2_/TRDRNA2_58133_c0~~gnl/TRDRNA2_/TRDRNA2_58133_c0_seq1.p1  ORF type:complete len:518 (+),score=76.28 gnl/TRDRNA2_/TRDRNA2_58133_c0_seq1:58-1611(+)
MSPATEMTVAPMQQLPMLRPPLGSKLAGSALGELHSPRIMRGPYAEPVPRRPGRMSARGAAPAPPMPMSPSAPDYPPGGSSGKTVSSVLAAACRSSLPSQSALLPEEERPSSDGAMLITPRPPQGGPAFRRRGPPPGCSRRAASEGRHDMELPPVEMSSTAPATTSRAIASPAAEPSLASASWRTSLEGSSRAADCLVRTPRERTAVAEIDSLDADALSQRRPPALSCSGNLSPAAPAFSKARIRVSSLPVRHHTPPADVGAPPHTARGVSSGASTTGCLPAKETVSALHAAISTAVTEDSASTAPSAPVSALYAAISAAAIEDSASTDDATGTEVAESSAAAPAPVSTTSEPGDARGFQSILAQIEADTSAYETKVQRLNASSVPSTPVAKGKAASTISVPTAPAPENMFGAAAACGRENVEDQMEVPYEELGSIAKALMAAGMTPGPGVLEELQASRPSSAVEGRRSSSRCSTESESWISTSRQWAAERLRKKRGSIKSVPSSPSVSTAASSATS